jgi:hypothetical protein
MVPVASADEEIRAEAVVFDQEGPSGFKPSIELDDGSISMNPVSGLEDDTSMHRLSPSGEEVEAR